MKEVMITLNLQHTMSWAKYLKRAYDYVSLPNHILGLKGTYNTVHYHMYYCMYIIYHMIPIHYSNLGIVTR